MNQQQIIDWLLEGDVAIQYQVYKDLLGIERKDLLKRIAHEGWGQQFLSKRHANLHWGLGFYQPKWTCSHYTLLDLRHLNLSPDNEKVKETIALILETSIAEDGGIQLGPSTAIYSDVCVNGMFLNYASYFRTEEQKLHSIVDCILNEIMPDGGFNCVTVRGGAQHSSLHSTLSVLEGLHEFQQTGYRYRYKDIQEALKSAEEFILIHQLFLSDRTGHIIKKEFLKLTYPGRWKYDILRAMDYFRSTGRAWDHRMEAAVKVMLKKKNKENTWNMQAAHPGKVHFTMEKTGPPSRWNTLRAIRVLQHFKYNQS